MKGVEIEELKTFRDARGWSAHPVDYARLRAGGIDNIHIVSMVPGALRGNHYHIEQTEDVFPMGGPVRIVARDMDTGETDDFTIGPDHAVRIRFAPRIAHVFQNVGDGVAYLVCSSDKAFSPDDTDMEREVLLES